MKLRIERKRGFLLVLSILGTLALISCGADAGGTFSPPVRPSGRVISDVTVYQAGVVDVATLKDVPFTGIRPTGDPYDKAFAEAEIAYKSILPEADITSKIPNDITISTVEAAIEKLKYYTRGGVATNEKKDGILTAKELDYFVKVEVSKDKGLIEDDGEFTEQDLARLKGRFTASEAETGEAKYNKAYSDKKSAIEKRTKAYAAAKKAYDDYINSRKATVPITVSWTNPLNVDDVEGYVVEFKSENGTWTALGDIEDDGMSVTGKSTNYIKSLPAKGDFRVGKSIFVRVRAISSSKVELFTGPYDADVEKDSLDINNDGEKKRLSEAKLLTAAVPVPVLGTNIHFPDYKTARITIADGGTRTGAKYFIHAYRLTEVQSVRIQTYEDFMHAKAFEFPLVNGIKVVGPVAATAVPASSSLVFSEDQLKDLLRTDKGVTDYDSSYVFAVSYNDGDKDGDGTIDDNELYPVKAFVHKFQKSVLASYSLEQVPLSPIPLPEQTASSSPKTYDVKASWVEPNTRGTNFLGIEATSLTYVLSRTSSSIGGGSPVLIYTGSDDKSKVDKLPTSLDATGENRLLPPYLYKLTIKNSYGELTSDTEPRLSYRATYSIAPNPVERLRLKEGEGSKTSFTYDLNAKGVQVYRFDLEWNFPADKGKNDRGGDGRLLNVSDQNRIYDLQYRIAEKDKDGKDFPYVKHTFSPSYKVVVVDDKASLRMLSTYDAISEENKNRKKFIFRIRYRNDAESWSEFTDAEISAEIADNSEPPVNALVDSIEFDELSDGVVDELTYFKDPIGSRKTKITVKWTLKNFSTAHSLGKLYDGSDATPGILNFRLGYKVAFDTDSTAANDADFTNTEVSTAGVRDGADFKGMKTLEIPFEDAQGEIIDYKFRVRVTNSAGVPTVLGKVSPYSVAPSLYLEGGPLKFQLDFTNENFAAWGSVSPAMQYYSLISNGAFPRYNTDLVRVQALPAGTGVPATVKKYRYIAGASRAYGIQSYGKRHQARAYLNTSSYITRSYASPPAPRVLRVNNNSGDRRYRETRMSFPSAIANPTMVMVASYGSSDVTKSKLFEWSMWGANGGVNNMLPSGRIDPRSWFNSGQADYGKASRSSNVNLLNVFVVAPSDSNRNTLRSFIDGYSARLWNSSFFYGDIGEILVFDDPGKKIFTKYGKILAEHMNRKYKRIGAVNPIAVDYAKTSIVGSGTEAEPKKLKVVLDPVPIGRLESRANLVIDTATYKYTAEQEKAYYGKTMVPMGTTGTATDAIYYGYRYYLKKEGTAPGVAPIFIGTSGWTEQFDNHPTQAGKKIPKKTKEFLIEGTSGLRSKGIAAGTYYLIVRKVVIKKDNSAHAGYTMWSPMPQDTDAIKVVIPEAPVATPAATTRN